MEKSTPLHYNYHLRFPFSCSRIVETRLYCRRMGTLWIFFHLKITSGGGNQNRFFYLEMWKKTNK